MATNRAKAGGQQGVNGEWYEGGKFLPSKADRAKQAPPALSRGRKAEIEPYVWEERPVDWAMPIWGSVKEFIDHPHLRRTGELRLRTDLEMSGPHWPYDSREVLQRHVDALIDGFRWKLSPQAPEGAGQYLVEGKRDSLR